MYTCHLADTLTICEIDGSLSKLSILGPRIMPGVRICSDDAVVIVDDGGNVAKYGNDGFMRTIQPLTRDTFALIP